MAYYPRVFYENGDEAGGGGDTALTSAALSQGRTPEEVKSLTDAANEFYKAEKEAAAARLADNEDLALLIERQAKAKRESAGIDEQAFQRTLDRTEAEKEQLKEIEAATLKEMERLNLATQIVDAIGQQVVALQDTRKVLGEATGLFGQFNDQLTDSVAMAAKFGKDQEVVGAAIGSLANNMMNFTQLSKDNQKTLIDSSIALGQFGVGAELAAKNNDFLMNSLGRSAEEAVGFQKDLIELGAEIGMNGKALVEGFAQNAKTLAKFGDQAEKVFKDLAKTAKETGVQMDDLFAVTEKFNTFEGAASAVGKMNAQLGTNLDAMALLQAETPTEQINMLRDSFLATGQSIESMTKFQRMAAADALGMDVSVLQNLMGPKEELPEAEKNFNELVKTTMTFMDKIGAIGKQMLTIFTPVIAVFSDILDFVSPALDLFGMLLLKLSELKPVVFALAAGLATFALITNGAAIATAAFGAVQTALSVGMGIATVATILFNMALLANPIGLIVAGVVALVVGFYSLSDELGGLGGLWDTIVSGMTFAWDNLADIVLFLPMTMFKAYKFAFNGIAKIFNSTLGKLSFTVPDWVPLIGGKEFGVPEIPMLAKGTNNFKGGSAIVGERGPELVNLPRGAEVIPNNKMQNAQGNVAAANTAANNKPPVVKLILNERELGQVVMDIIDKKLSVTTGIN